VAFLAPLAAVLAVGCVDLFPTGPVENGRIAETSLATITPQCRVISPIAGRLRALLAAANAAGVGLAPEQSSFLPAGVQGPPRIESCYRTYEMQVWWRNYYCSIGKCGNAAVAGTSKHGLGRAVDFQDQNGELTFQSPGYAWLTAHAGEYGFFQPPSVQQSSPSAEAWHWEAQVSAT
jgi:hypothetical protein